MRVCDPKADLYARADDLSNIGAAEDNLQEYKRILAAGGSLPGDIIRPAEVEERAPQENSGYGGIGQMMGGEVMDIDQPDMPNIDDFGLRK